MPARPADSAILEALAQLELKLTALITTGLAQIKDDHARAQLEQAKINAAFANRDTVEAIRRQVDTHTTELLTMAGRWDESARDRRDLRAAIDTLSDLISSRTISNYDRWTLALAGVGFSSVVVLFSFLLNHLVH